MKKRLEGMNALVTGAERGIGKAIALALGREGANVLINHYIDEAAGQAVVEALRDLGVEAQTLAADITVQEDVERLVRAVEPWGGLDILVNNAGITRDKALFNMRPEEWSVVIDTNLNGTFRVTRAAVRGMMKRKKGSIINISSVSALTGMAGQTNYSAAKAGIVGFTKALAREVAPFGVTVNCVAPGPTQTDMLKTIPDKVLKQTIASIPLRRLGEPWEIAEAVLFLASPSARFITGHVLTVDGGLTM